MAAGLTAMFQDSAYKNPPVSSFFNFFQQVMTTTSPMDQEKLISSIMGTA